MTSEYSTNVLHWKGKDNLSTRKQHVYMSTRHLQKLQNPFKQPYFPQSYHAILYPKVSADSAMQSSAVPCLAETKPWTTTASQIITLSTIGWIKSYSSRNYTSDAVIEFDGGPLTCLFSHDRLKAAVSTRMMIPHQEGEGFTCQSFVPVFCSIYQVYESPGEALGYSSN